MTPLVEFRSVAKAFGNEKVFEEISFTIVEGESHALLGPSGCGKSTVLRLLAGLDQPNAGKILIEGKLVSDDAKCLVAPHERQLAMVFQDLALWPDLTALENVMLGMAQLKLARSGRRAKALSSLATCGIENLASRKPREASVGQQQRIALARALAGRPKLLLLDEPFSGLDAVIKRKLFQEIETHCVNFGITLLLVTHDSWEATGLCSHAVVIEDGHVAEHGRLCDVLRQPASIILRSFVSQWPSSLMRS
ncbi:MAG: ABC transporter ATP-binding protein [Chthoniobacterales bacterium]|nr:ABC transporter ATP-binding protein [Chthoniobacterales bacterium]